MTINEYIDNVVWDWKERDLLYDVHQEDELRVTLLRLSIFVQDRAIKTIQEINQPNRAPIENFTCRRCKDWTANSHELCNDCMQEVSE